MTFPLTTFTVVAPEDIERFATNTVSRSIYNILNLALSGKGIPRNKISLIPTSGQFVSEENSTDAGLYMTASLPQPAVSFTGMWDRNRSYALTYFEFDNEDWVK